jgi:hypothetical protein
VGAVARPAQLLLPRSPWPPGGTAAAAPRAGCSAATAELTVAGWPVMAAAGAFACECIVPAALHFMLSTRTSERGVGPWVPTVILGALVWR